MVTVPVADVDRAKAFYVDQVGFHEDMDVRTDRNRRFVRLTPPGSVCCVAIGEGWIDSAPGSLQGTQLVVEDVDEARAFLVGRGVEVTEVQEYPWGRFCFSVIRTATGGRCRSRPQRPDRTPGAAACCF